MNSITFTGNTVNGTLATGSYFRAAIAADEAGGVFSGNTLQTINHDVLVRFGSNGNITITGNNFNGGGVELALLLGQGLLPERLVQVGLADRVVRQPALRLVLVDLLLVRQDGVALRGGEVDVLEVEGAVRHDGRRHG